MRLIDADELIKTFCSHCVDHDECKSECMDLKIIKSMKTVDTERHGNWIVIGKRTDCEYVLIFKCSCCHTPFIGMVDRYHYCPNCGAKIDEIEEGEVVVTKKEIERIKDCANFSKMDEVEK